MFKATCSLQKSVRRLPLSPKQAGKEYYKGNRVGSLGTIDRYGNFSPDWNKIRTYVYPIHGTSNVELTPFVSNDVWKTTKNDAGLKDTYPKRFTGEDYLRAWKIAGGYDNVNQEMQESSNTNIPTPFEEKPATKS